MSPPTCDTCKYHHALSGGCRRAPPAAFLIPGPGGQPAVIGGWPPVRPEQWCGQHEPRLSLAGDA